MAIFNSKKNKDKKVEEKTKISSKAIRREMGEIFSGSKNSFSEILIRPRITEKATEKSEQGVYTFDVSPRATKSSISFAVEQLYKVKPTKVAIVTIRAKKILARGKRGKTSGGKKAYVYLKKGDKIEFV